MLSLTIEKNSTIDKNLKNRSAPLAYGDALLLSLTMKLTPL